MPINIGCEERAEIPDRPQIRLDARPASRKIKSFWTVPRQKINQSRKNISPIRPVITDRDRKDPTRIARQYIMARHSPQSREKL
jgi:hypothetical protein